MTTGGPDGVLLPGTWRLAITALRHSKLHDEQVASLAGKGYFPYRVDETGTHLMKPRKPNSVPLNATATVLTGGLWLVTALPIISTSKTDSTKFIPSEGIPDSDEDVSIGAAILGFFMLLALVLVVWAIWSMVSYAFSHPVLLLIPVAGLVVYLVLRAFRRR